jgi:hypothetical protein
LSHVAKDYPRNIQNIQAKLNTKWFSGFREEYFKIFANNLSKNTWTIILLELFPFDILFTFKWSCCLYKEVVCLNVLLVVSEILATHHFQLRLTNVYAS